MSLFQTKARRSVHKTEGKAHELCTHVRVDLMFVCTIRPVLTFLVRFLLVCPFQVFLNKHTFSEVRHNTEKIVKLTNTYSFCLQKRMFLKTK